MTNQQLFRALRDILARATPEADAEARLVMSHCSGSSWSSLLLRFGETAEAEGEALACAEERLTGRPLAYILGERCFYGADYVVDERVLIPRFDTESVAEAAIQAARERGLRSVADVCCGSGCLGITVARECPVESLALSDISAGALEVAELNAARLLPSLRPRITCADLLDGLDGPVDLIVCNPPYIPEADLAGLEAQVRDHEPRLALAAPEDGLLFYRRLSTEAPPFLNPGGVLVAELGDGQEDAVVDMLREAGWGDVRTGNDFSGKPRHVRASLGEEGRLQ